MKRTTFAGSPCSIARTVDLLGDWWTPLVLREACYGVRRFEDFQRHLGIGRNILTQRLARLVEEGLFERVRYQDHPPRHEYVLTAKGRDFFPVLAAMARWGDDWLAADDDPPTTTLHHAACDHSAQPKVVCGHCGQPLTLDDVRALPAVRSSSGTAPRPRRTASARPRPRR